MARRRTRSPRRRLTRPRAHQARQVPSQPAPPKNKREQASMHAVIRPHRRRRRRIGREARARGVVRFLLPSLAPRARGPPGRRGEGGIGSDRSRVRPQQQQWGARSSTPWWRAARWCWRSTARRGATRAPWRGRSWSASPAAAAAPTATSPTRRTSTSSTPSAPTASPRSAWPTTPPDVSACMLACLVPPWLHRRLSSPLLLALI
jgi:hypothetical protein